MEIPRLKNYYIEMFRNGTHGMEGIPNVNRGPLRDGSWSRRKREDRWIQCTVYINMKIFNVLIGYVIF